MPVLDSGGVPTKRTSSRPASAGELVQQARLRAGLTQEELADRVGKHVTTIQNLEGDRSRSRSTVDAVARALKTTPDALGYHFRKPLRPSDLSDEQRDLVDELLSLPEDEQRAVRELLARMRDKKKGRKR